ncbi:MAG: hypothetical protein ACR2JM_12885, partial [Mycobacterium sp.]
MADEDGVGTVRRLTVVSAPLADCPARADEGAASDDEVLSAVSAQASPHPALSASPTPSAAA